MAAASPYSTVSAASSVHLETVNIEYQTVVIDHRCGFRFRESIQETLGGVVHESQREVLAPLLRHSEQSRPYGCRYVDRHLSRHDDIASQ
jgi:hypothetical protein